jgi:hypothetical protein
MKTMMKKGMTGKKPMGIKSMMAEPAAPMMKKGGKVKKYAKGGSIDGVASRGKTRAC